jgi:hypothetical protein
MSDLGSMFLSVARSGPRRLQQLMLRGEPPAIEELVGWEYRGINMPATSAVLGLRRFVKGFVADDEALALGYNKLVQGTDLTAPWTAKVRSNGRAAYAPFAVERVDPAARDNQHLNAVLLDYSAAPVPEPGMPSRLRDYLERVVPGSDDLLIGQAFMAFGGVRVPIGWFVLERLGPADPSDRTVVP